MVNLLKEIDAEKENVKGALANLHETMARKEKSIVELAAIAQHNLQTIVEFIAADNMVAAVSVLR